MELNKLTHFYPHNNPRLILLHLQFFSTIKVSAVQTQTTSAISKTITSSKSKTKISDTIAKRQPRKQLSRATFGPATQLEVKYTEDKQYITQRLCKHYSSSVITTKFS